MTSHDEHPRAGEGPKDAELAAARDAHRANARWRAERLEEVGRDDPTG